MRVSYTKLDTYKLCHRKYKFYIEKAPQDPSRTVALRFGRAVHQALEFAYSRRYRPPTLDQVLKYYDSIAGSSIFEDDPLQVRDLFSKRGRGALSAYLSANKPESIVVVEAEKKFLMQLDNRHEIEGIIDRVDMLPDGSFEIIDYQTGSPQDAERLSENWQLAIYQFAKQRKLQTKRIRSSLVYIIYNGHKLTYQFNKNELEDIRGQILATIETIEQDQEFPPHVNRWCDTCPYQPICPSWEHKFLYGEEQQAVPELTAVQEKIDHLLRISAAIRRLSAEAGQLKKIVAHFAKDRNLTRLFSDLGTISVHLRQKVHYDTQKIRELLPEEFLRQIVRSIDTKKLAEFEHDLPQDIREEIEKNKETITSESVIVRPHGEPSEEEEMITP